MGSWICVLIVNCFQLVKFVRYHGGKNNLANKTLIDKRFLI